MKLKKEDIFAFMFSTSSRYFKRAVNQELEKYDLTHTQCGVIRMLLHEEELSQAEIADRFLSDRATIGSVIQKLQDKEFIDKKLSDKDKRSYVVSLKPKARELAGEIDQVSEKVTKKALEGLSKEEIGQLLQMLNKIVDNLK